MPKKWNKMTTDYELIKSIGFGSSGRGLKAIHKRSGRMVAIKLIDGIKASPYNAIKTLREVQIMRMLT